MLLTIVDVSDDRQVVLVIHRNEKQQTIVYLTVEEGHVVSVIVLQMQTVHEEKYVM